MKFAIGGAIAASIIVVLFLVVSPFVAFSGFQSALESGDTDKIAQYINFEELRSNLKVRLRADIGRQLANSDLELDDEDIAGFAGSFAGSILDGMVDTFVTREGLNTMFENAGNATIANNFADASFSYRSWTKVAVQSPWVDGTTIILGRNGLGWQVVDLEIDPAKFENLDTTMPE